jgi:quinoprotein glucose dehydrogenase
MVYVAALNTPALLKMSTQTRWPQPGSAASTAGETRGHVLYQQDCQGCHGADFAGGGSGVSLVGITKRLSPDAIQATILYGLGQMNGFAGTIPDDDISSIISYLANPKTGGGRLSGLHPQAPPPVQLGGDVVGWGGAPAGQAAFRKMNQEGTFGVWFEYPFPKGLKAYEQRYYTGYNLEANAIRPPWNEFTAYDLNNGTIKWQVSLGSSPGLLGKQIGSVVTASGLIFFPTQDGKVRAYDADTGKILWTGDLPAGAYGIPAMYQLNGREYLVICATVPIEQPGAMPARSAGTEKIQRAYVAFALPEGQSN